MMKKTKKKTIKKIIIKDKKTTIQKLSENLSKSIKQLDLISQSKSMKENSEEFIQTKQKQVEMLRAKFIQSKFTRALQIDDIRDKVMNLILSKLEDAPPENLMAALQTLSEISQKDITTLMPQSSPGVNLQINQDLRQETLGIPTASSPVTDASFMKTMKSMANLYEHVVDEARKTAKEIDVKQLPDDNIKK